MKLANGQDTDYSEKKKNGPRASPAPFHNIQKCSLVYIYR